MNCANHPDVAVVSYCQSCGKPLCAECIRSVGGVIYCEPCLAARMASAPMGANPLAGSNLSGLHAHPLLAGLLGFIPGVGAMYNGQFVKALAHVLIFAVFVSLSDKSFIFGLLVAAWVFYQVFDAAQTAKARRDGLPLPNPFGLNDLGSKLGMTPGGAPWAAGFTAPPGTTGPATGGPADPNPFPGSAPGQSQGPGWNPVQPPPAYGASYAVPPSAPGMPYSGSASAGPGPGGPGFGGPGFGAPGSNFPGGAPVYGSPLPLESQSHKHPLGAVVLIVIGVMLLLHTLGVFEDEWIGRTWPLILIGVGGWLLYRRTRDTQGNRRGGS
jgi:TM2 domain-containing membrane protein YozV